MTIFSEEEVKQITTVRKELERIYNGKESVV